MGSFICNGLCERHRDEWRIRYKQPEIEGTEAGKYKDAMLCTRCDIRMWARYATGKSQNRCPCCSQKMRNHRRTAIGKKIRTLGYDPRDKKRI